jgi:hypothetical protein
MLTNKHPRDSNIFFDEEPHIYYVNDKKIDTSVTSFVHSFFPHFNAKKWAKVCARKGKKPDNKYSDMSENEILDMWEENRVQSTTDGTFLHKSIESFYNNIPVENDTIEFSYFMKFHEKFKDELIPYRTEWEIYHEELDLAGSIDMIFTDPKGNFHIYDWKRSKEIKKISNEYGSSPVDHLPNTNFWHYSLQLNMYKYILESKYLASPIQDMYLVVIHPDDFAYRRILVPDLQNDIVQLVNHRLNHLKDNKGV